MWFVAVMAEEREGDVTWSSGDSHTGAGFTDVLVNGKSSAEGRSASCVHSGFIQSIERGHTTSCASIGARKSKTIDGRYGSRCV